MSTPGILYPLYDGRYLTDSDRAVCYTICNTIQEARKEAPEYGDDTVIVKATGTWNKGKSNFTCDKEEIVN